MKKKDPISYLATNLRHLRKSQDKTQQEMAEALLISRVKWNAYENGINLTPPIMDLMRFAEYFSISIDTLVKVDLQGISDVKLKELQSGNDSYMTGTKLRVLPTTVNQDNKENIEFVPIKAKAGYLKGYHDPKFISSLPSFHLPILKNDRKYRLFPVTGDSMLPFPEDAFMIGQYVENWLDIKDGDKCLLITKEQGFVLKEVKNELKKNRSLVLRSLNPIYEPYRIQVEDVLEIWKFSGYIDLKFPEQQFSPEMVVDEIDKFKNHIINLAANGVGKGKNT